MLACAGRGKREAEVRGQRYVARYFLPGEMKVVFGCPEIGARRIDRVDAARGVIGQLARRRNTAHVGLGFKDPQRSGGSLRGGPVWKANEAVGDEEQRERSNRLSAHDSFRNSARGGANSRH